MAESHVPVRLRRNEGLATDVCVCLLRLSGIASPHSIKRRTEGIDSVVVALGRRDCVSNARMTPGVDIACDRALGSAPRVQAGHSVSRVTVTGAKRTYFWRSLYSGWRDAHLFTFLSVLTSSGCPTLNIRVTVQSPLDHPIMFANFGSVLRDAL